MIKKERHRWIACLTAAVCILSAYALPVRAQSEGEAKIPVQQILSQVNGGENEQVQKSFAYTLQPKSTADPMPDGTAEGAYVFSMQGNAETHIRISFPETGVFGYTLKQTAQNETQEWTTDGSVYDIEVYVKATDRETPSTEVIIKNSEHDKLAKAVFTNEYIRKAPAPAANATHTKEPVKTGDTGRFGIICFGLIASFFVGVYINGRMRRNV